MKTKLLYWVCAIFMICINGISRVHAQAVEENQEVRTFLDDMFQSLDKSKVPNGLLRDYAFDLVDWDLYSGETLTDKNYVDRHTYEMLLRTIRSAAVSTKPYGDVNEILKAQYNGGSENTASLSAAVYQYAVIKANALDDGLINYVDGKVSDKTKNGVWQNPYETRYVIGFSAHDSIFINRSITFKLNSNCWLTNLSYTKIELDVGNGYQSISVGGNLTMTYPSNGWKEIKLRVTLSNGKQLISHHKIFVNEPTTASRAGVEEWEEANGESYRGISTKAQLFRLGSSSFQKTLIWVEGFDPRTLSKNPEVGTTNASEIRKNLLSSFVGNQILNEYTIIYVDWEESEEFIQCNANTLIDAFDKINQEKERLGVTTPNIVLGQSMGGLVARYALKTMENQGIEHNTSVFISDDTPHLGANVPLSVLYGLHGINSFLENKQIISGFLNTGTLQDLLMKVAHCHSAQQMLVNYVDYGGNLNNTEHALWQQELAALGFPQGDKGKSFKMLGIANGNYSPEVVPDAYLKANVSGSSELLNLLPFLSSVAVGVIFQDWLAGLLNLLPGTPSIKMVVELKPGVSPGGMITNIELNYTKKFLWMVKITRRIFNYKKYLYSGGLLYDTYPSSYYPLEKMIESSDGGHAFVGRYDFDIEMAKQIPFVPTSSALCVGKGEKTLTASMFTKAPTVTDTPFGSNIYMSSIHKTEHIDLNADILDWIFAQLNFGIIGPRQGADGTQYTAAGATGAVQWSSSNANVATIGQDGKLKVTGKGVVTITATCGRSTDSKEIMVGTPRFVLADVVREPGFYRIKAQCIDSEFADFMADHPDAMIYKWGIKTNEEPLEWIISDSPELHLGTLEDKDNTTVYLKTEDMYGNESSSVFVRVSGYDIYDLTYDTFIVNKNGSVFDKNGLMIFYDIATLGVSYREGAYDEFYNGKWNPFAAMVVNDEGDLSDLRWDNQCYVHDILPEEEIKRIQGFPDNTSVIFRFLLFNYDHEVIQITPITVMYKSNFPQ